MQLPMNLNIVPSKIYCGVWGHSGGCTIVRKDAGILCVKLRLDEMIQKFSSYYISILLHATTSVGIEQIRKKFE